MYTNKHTDTATLGFAQTDITPSGSVQTIGFGRPDEHSRGVQHPLLAQAAVWKLEERVCCLICIDHIGFARAHADALRDAAGALLDTDREHIMLLFSHTHAAPNDSIETQFAREADKRILDAVRKAAAHTEPVYAAWENATADLAVNRRSGAETMDRRVGILKASDPISGAPKLLLFRVTAHANCLKADNFAISPDWFGAARDRLEQRYGCPVLLTQGASGNAAPRFFTSAYDPPDVEDENRFVRTPLALEEMARELDEKTAPVLAQMRPKPVRSLHMRTVQETFYAEVPSPARAMEIADEAWRYCGIDATDWLAETDRLQKAGITRQTETITLQYFRLNEGCLCGVPNEILCEFALRAEKELQDPYFYFGGYTNGCTAYFPTEEEFDRGGYEVYWGLLSYFRYHGRVFPLDRESAEHLICAAVRNQ